MFRILKYNLSESFNVVRWCLTAITFCFVAVVSVAKFVQMTDMTALTFSSLEIAYLILNDTTNIVYIYLPLYLFLICGIMFDDNFGSLEIIKCGSRKNWVLAKCFTLLFYTVAYFALLIGTSLLMSNQVFPYSAVWSSDFLKVQVLLGESVSSFVHSPLTTIGLSICSVFFLYLCAGSMSVMLSLLTRKEVYALFGSLLGGISISVLFVFVLDSTQGVNLQAFTTQNLVLLVTTILFIVGSIYLTNKRDFHLEKKA